MNDFSDTALTPETATLLIVDDVPENLEVLAELLQSRYRVRAAQSGARALQGACTPPRPDLILLDVMMPDMDGFEVAARLRADPATRDIPVIFVTALDGVQEEEHGLELGARERSGAGRIRRATSDEPGGCLPARLWSSFNLG